MQVFGGWHDPCPYPRPEGHDGLETEWGDPTYCNPPYSNPLPWVLKAIHESRKGKLVMMLLPNDSSTTWWRLLHQEGARFFLLAGRIRFVGAEGMPRFASMLALLNGREGGPDG
jgi:hypothetical protein